MSSRVIVLELNELSPTLIDRLIARGELPNFARLRAQSLEAVTDAAEPALNLEPWIQWVTVHTGLSYAQHRVFNLDDGPKLTAPRVWDVISDAGEPVWVCGSMNAATAGDGLNGWFMPDPWSSGIKPYPERELAPFFRFVQTYVQEHDRPDVPLSKLDHARFVAFMIANGLSARTVRDTIRQLLGEVGKKDSRWRRAAILDRLQWDLFRARYRRLQPKFATFFANSTAHFQHYHWREMEPGLFTVQPSPADRDAYADAIPFGYRRMDAIVGEALQLAGPDTSIVLCTALSQQPLLRYEAQGGKQVFKPRDAAVLIHFAGVEDPYRYAPVMAEEFHLRFDSHTAAERAEARLTGLRLASGETVIKTRRNGAEVFVGCTVTAPPPADAEVISLTNQTTRFHGLYAGLEGLKSGGHHPDGVLWIRTPQGVRRTVRRKVSLTELAPTFLALCDLPPSSAFAVRAMPEVVQALSGTDYVEKVA